MKINKELRAKVKFNISYFIEEQLLIRNWTKDLLLKKLNISEIDFYKFIESEEPLNELFANEIAFIFSSSTQYWVNIDRNYKNWKTTIKY